MKKQSILISIILLLVIVFFSCDKARECDGFMSGNLANRGAIDFEANYGMFATDASLINPQPGNPSIDSCVRISLDNFDNCTLRSSFHMYHCYTLNDTFRFDPSETGNSLFFSESDIFFGVYDINPDFDNWIIIKSFSSGNTVMSGEFELSFVIPTDERFIPADDPDRPDTLYYTNGSFDAEFVFFE